jgi:hypothetical protein
LGFMHIDNLSKNRAILQFREAFALEKIDGSSSWITLRRDVEGLPLNQPDIRFHSGGAKHESFVSLFDREDLRTRFLETGFKEMTVYGEAYGGKIQGMSGTYGPHLKFVAFDVKHKRADGDRWLDVPTAEGVVKALGLEFVAYERTSTDLAALDAQRDLPSRQAKRNGILEDKIAEGVILRPIHEFLMPDGSRVIAKHKRAEFSERKSKADASSDPVKLAVLDAADKVAEEFVTPMRLNHVLDKITRVLIGHGQEPFLSAGDTKAVIAHMVDDIRREGAGEFEYTKNVEKAIGRKTAAMYKEWLEEHFRREVEA